MYVQTQNSYLAATGVIFQGKVDDINQVLLKVIDIGTATITFEYSTDNSSWSSLATGVYTPSSGLLVSNGGATCNAKGLYYVDVSTLTYLRISVSAYTSGIIRTSFELSVDTLFRINALFQTGLTAQGSTQASALPIQAWFNQFSTAAASTGAILPVNVAKGGQITVRNDGVADLTVYPPVGYKINGGTTNAGVTVGAGFSREFTSDGAGNFWMFASQASTITSRINTGLTAAGTDQATALALTANFNVLSTTAASTGVILPTGVPKGEEVTVVNGGASTLNIFPPVGKKINGGSDNAAITAATTVKTRLISDGAGNFWAVG